MNSNENSIVSALIEASAIGDLSTVASLLSQCADVKEPLRKALCSAALNGHAECVKLLILKSSRESCSDAICVAANQGHADCVKLLLPASCPNTENSTALLTAAENGHAECVALLIPTSNLRVADFGALRHSVVHGHLECLRALLSVSYSWPRKIERWSKPPKMAAMSASDF